MTRREHKRKVECIRRILRGGDDPTGLPAVLYLLYRMSGAGVRDQLLRAYLFRSSIFTYRRTGKKHIFTLDLSDWDWE